MEIMNILPIIMLAWQKAGKIQILFLYNFTDSKSTSEACLVSLNMKQILGDNWYHNLTIGYATNGYETTNLTASKMSQTDSVYATRYTRF